MTDYIRFFEVGSQGHILELLAMCMVKRQRGHSDDENFDKIKQIIISHSVTNRFNYQYGHSSDENEDCESFHCYSFIPDLETAAPTSQLILNET